MNKVKVRSTINCIGLRAGQEAELELTYRVLDLARAGILLILRPVD